MRSIRRISATMNKAKSHKILILLAVIVLCFTAGFSAMAQGTRQANAATVTATGAATYFTGVEKVSYDGGNVKVTPAENEVLAIKNSISVDDLAIELSVSGISSLKITLSSDSYNVNGNKKADDKFDTEIENVLVIDFSGNSATIYFNDESKSAGQTVSISQDDLKVTFKANNNVLTAGLNGTEITETDEYYKIAGAVCSAKITIKAEAEANATAEYNIKAIDQKASDVKKDYRQTFTVTDGKIENALPVVALGGDFKGYEKLNVYNGTKYNVSFTLYGVFNGVSSSDVYLGADEDSIKLYNTKEKPKDIQFNENGSKTFYAKYKDGDVEKTLATFTANVSKCDSDTDAPVYDKTNTDALDAFKYALKKATLVNAGEENEHSIALGGKITIPSLKDLVNDNTARYEDLKHTVYYSTPTGNSSTSDWSIPVNTAGTYKFYVVFKDGNGNSMTEEDFFTKDPDDGNKIKTEGTYYDFYFSFVINDNAPISVTAVEQGMAYKGIKFVASGFNIESSGYNAEYQLYYNPDANAEVTADGWEDSWVLVPKASAVDEDDEIKGISYADVKSIGYDGARTFIPNLSGTYAIKCTVASTASVRSSSATMLIRVSDDVVTVKPASHWVRDNVWSVVFLSVGTLALIGFVVLLFIKPKEEIEESTGEEIKK